MSFITILFDVHCYNSISGVPIWYILLLNWKNYKLNVTTFQRKWVFLILKKNKLSVHHLTLGGST